MRTKAQWRSHLLAARRAVPAEVRTSEARLLALAATEATSSITPVRSTVTVCCYVPFGHEPGSLSLLDTLREAGHEVLLPVVPTDHTGSAAPPRALGWARYQDPSSLVDGPYGLRQPARAQRGPDAIAAAHLVLIPALAVDRRGVRLGRGAGWYDRSLPLVRPGTPLVAVVRDTEVVDALPAEQHDVLMTGVLTPHNGLRALPLS